MTDFIKRIERLEEEKAGIAGDMGEVLAQHKLWLDSYGKEGKKADLHRANLYRADLSGAVLKWANMYGANMYEASLKNADLQGANLSRADLKGANLWGTIGNMQEIKSLQLDTYSITYTFDRLQIGCENHSIEEWRGFSDEDIEEMGSKALGWWRKYRDHIFKTIELSPATPTGYEGK